MAVKNASERTPLLASSGNGHTSAPAQQQRGYAATDADQELDEVAETKRVQAEAERIKAQLPMSMVVPSVVSLMSCLCIAAIDGTLIISLVGSVSSSFDASDRIFWLTTAYMLGLCAFSPVYGRTCDIVGRKASLIVAVLMFALGTLMCATAPSMTTLIIGRGVQGIGAGGIQPCIGVVLNDLIPLSKRGVMHAIGQVVFSTGNSLGGPVGGLLADRFGWRFAFSIQIPPIILALTLLTCCLKLPDLPKTPKQIREEEYAAGQPVLTRIRKHLDISGAILLVTGATSFLLAFTLVTVQDLKWSNPRVWGLLLTSLCLMVGFLHVEAFYAKEPLVPMRLLQKRTLAATWMILVLYNFASGILYYFPLYFQTILEQSATEVGRHLLPLAISTTCGSFFAGWYMKKVGRYYYLNLCGAALAVVTPFCIASWNEVNRPSRLLQNTVMIPQGFGICITFTILMVTPLAIVERHEQSQIIGMMYLFRNLGGILGVSSSGYLIQSLLQNELAKRITGPGAARKIDEIRRNIDIVPSLPPQERLATKQSYAISLSIFQYVMGIIMVVCFFLCFLIEERDLNADAKANTSEAAPTQDGDEEAVAG